MTEIGLYNLDLVDQINGMIRIVMFAFSMNE